MKVLVVASTRPEVIKLSPVMRILEEKDVEYVFATTGQHYDYALFQAFVKDLKLREPDYNVTIGSGPHGEQTLKSIIGLEKIMKKEKPEVALVEGDTNSVLSAALAGVKLQIPVGHVEAGLRSYDKNMPEEVNRVLVDHCSELLFAPTEEAGLNLVSEGIMPGKIFITGNTIVDATLQNLEIAENRGENPCIEGEYLLLTLHRAENVDRQERLEEMIGVVNSLGERVIFPVHPRTRQRIEGLPKELLSNIEVIPPLSYLEFLPLLKRAKAVLTDSGGLQEEAAVLKVPCFTLRTTTERPESVEAGGNIIAGVRGEDIRERISGVLRDGERLREMRRAENPFGDGRAGERIVEIILERYEKGELRIPVPDFTRGVWRRRFILVDEKLEGRRVEDLRPLLEVSRIIDGDEEIFPRGEVRLKKGQIIEAVEKPGSDQGTSPPP
jgi:UDP-N-acetylglucosamine 2-epimerase (non-hydrolysing)